MFKVARKNLLAHKLRMLLTVVSIVLGVSFISGTYVFTDSISKTFNGIFTEVFSGVDLTVESTVTDGFDESVLDQVKAIEGIDVAEPGVSGRAQLVDKDGQAIGGNGPPTLGFSWGDDEGMNPLRIESGREPTAAGEFVLDLNTAEQNDFKVGDMVKIASIDAAEDFELVGIVRFGEASTLAGATLSAFELNEAQRFFGDQGQLDDISIRVNDDAKVENVRASLEAELGEDFKVATGNEQLKNAEDEINQGLGFINYVLLGFAFVSFVVAVFIIYNTFKILVSQRSRELALLRAVGATKFQVTRSVIYESLLVGLFSAVIGLFAGIGLAEGLRAVGNQAGLGLPEGTFVIENRTIIVSLLVGVIVTVLSALIPAIVASKAPPVAALKSTQSSQIKGGHIARTIIAALFALFSALLIGLGLFVVSGLLASTLLSVFGLMLLMVTAVVASPALMPIAINTVGSWMELMFGSVGKIARLNIRRAPSRAASASAALMIGVSLVAFSTVFTSSIKATIDQVFADSVPADLIASSAGEPGVPPVSNQLTQRLADLDGIETASPVFLIEPESQDNVGGFFVAYIEPDTFDDVISLDVSENGYDRLQGETVLVRSTFLDVNGWQVGQSISVAADNKVIDYEIVGTFDKDYDSKLLINSDQLDENTVADGSTVLFVNYEDGVDTDVIRKRVDEVAIEYPGIAVQSQAELIESAEKQIDQILGLFWALLGLAILIAIIGIANTLVLSITERKREVGLLRAVGMTKRQVKGMVRIEAIIIAVFGALLGIALGVVQAWVMLQVLEDEGLTEFAIPWLALAIAVVLAIVAGLLSSIWPSRMAAKTDILAAIKTE